MLLKLKEKRGFARMGINIPMSIVKNGQEIQGECIDISGTGMQIKIKEESLNVGDEVFLQLSTGHKLFRPLEVTGNVVRISQAADGFVGAVNFPVLN